MMPEVPTMDEAGIKGYDVSNWNAIWAPAKTPREVIQRLNRDIAQSMESADVKERVAAQGNLVAVDTPEAFATFIGREAAKWSKVIKDANVKLD